MKYNLKKNQEFLDLAKLKGIIYYKKMQWQNRKKWKIKTLMKYQQTGK